MTAPLVSVLMCTYNGIEFLAEAVSDILSQSYSNLELIICDDGSTDGTREWLREMVTDPRARIYNQPSNLGYVANKNFALAQAQGTFITQMDQDDRCPHNRIEVMVRAAEESGEAIIGSAFDRLLASGERKEGDDLASDITIHTPPAVGETYPFWFPSLLIRRDVFDVVGPWDEYFAGIFGDDMYWTVRANERFPIRCLRDHLYAYRDAPTSITKTMDRPRKLVAPGLLERLLQQRRETGTDSLEQGKFAQLEAVEQSLLQDKRYVSEQLRGFAAVAIDHERFDEAGRMLVRAISLTPWRAQPYRTALYLVRAKLKFGHDRAIPRVQSGQNSNNNKVASGDA